MGVFNLAKFPNVCRLCLKPESKELYPVDGSFEQISLHIGSFLDDVTFRVPENKIQYLPKFVCGDCLKELSDFAVYRNKLVLTLRFMEALIDLKNSNQEPLSALFRENKKELDTLFSELSLCTKAEPHVEDLLAEFESYGLVNYETAVKKEEKEPSDVEEDDRDHECPEGNSSDVEIKPDIYLCMVSPPRDDSSEFFSEDEKPLRGKTKAKPKPKSSANPDPSSGPKRRGRPRLIHPDEKILKEPWSCDKCKFKTNYRRSVAKHKAVHEKRENRTHPCPSCGVAFKTWKLMREHMTSHPEYQLVCEICGLALRSASALKQHMDRHEGIKYSCEYCDFSTYTKTTLTGHMVIHMKDKDNFNYRCDVCGLLFRKASILKNHMESHLNERKYPCEHCPARFNTANALRGHRKRVHLAIRHPCEHCDKTFDDKMNLRDHMERVHQIQCRFVCDICVVTYDSQEKLDGHRQRHENPKPLECRVCLSLYTTQEEFDGHLCISYRADYHCCNKDLRNHNQYNRHMWTKHGLKTNDRVKPIPGVLLGQLRGTRKRLIQCRKCDIAFPTQALKQQHMAQCMWSSSSSSSQAKNSIVDGNYNDESTF